MVWIAIGVIWLAALIGAVYLLVVRANPHETTHPTGEPHRAPRPNEALTPDVQAGLRRTARIEFEEALKRSVSDFSANLAQTTDSVTEQVRGLSLATTTESIEAYRKGLSELEASITQSVEEAHRSITESRAQLISSLEAETASTKAELRAALDQRLTDVVASYLTETLGTASGAIPKAWLIEQLEAHKEELKEEILGAPPSP